MPNVIPFGGKSDAQAIEMRDTATESAEIDAILAGIRLLTPRQRLTLWTLVEHTRLLDAVETIVDELSQGLR
jgi:hypothetical protein